MTPNLEVTLHTRLANPLERQDMDSILTLGVTSKKESTITNNDFNPKGWFRSAWVSTRAFLCGWVLEKLHMLAFFAGAPRLLLIWLSPGFPMGPWLGPRPRMHAREQINPQHFFFRGVFYIFTLSNKKVYYEVMVLRFS